MEPTWLTEARTHIGQQEMPGAASNQWIKAMWMRLKGGAWFWKAYGEDDSKLPWCGGFVAYCLTQAGIEPPAKYAGAKEWLTWGAPLKYASEGCIVVFTRAGGGHVGFVVGMDERNRLMVLGGNQGDKVSIAPFDLSRVVGYRWPSPCGYQPVPALTVMANNEQSSTNEA
ncbi:MAG: TIGR02594 family protein [Candidatus Ferrigenium altingense]